jgi:hypothetical protein
MDTLHRYTDLPDTVNSLFWVYHSLTLLPRYLSDLLLLYLLKSDIAHLSKISSIFLRLEST